MGRDAAQVLRLWFVRPAGPGCLWPHGCSGRRASCSVGPGCLVCPWAAARPRAVRAASLWLGASPRSPARPRHRPRALQPGPSGPSGALHTSGAWCAVGCFGASFRSSARPSLRPRPPPPGPVGRLGRWSETGGTFVRVYLRRIETAIAFAGEEWACLGQFSDAEAMPVSVAPSWGRTEASSVSKSPCFCVLCAKFFAPTSPAPVLHAARRSPHC